MAPKRTRSLAARWTLALGRLPWWTWAVLAIATSLALHSLALRPQVIVMDGSQPGAALPALVLGGLASELQLQLLVPPLCLLSVPMVRELMAGVQALAVPIDDETPGMSASAFDSLAAPASGQPRARD